MPRLRDIALGGLIASGLLAGCAPSEEEVDFLAKKAAGPVLIVADRIDAIHHWLESQGLAAQFHPSYTRMVPAHYIVEIQLVGCPSIYDKRS
jgi:hypothetical protein